MGRQGWYRHHVRKSCHGKPCWQAQSGDGADGVDRFRLAHEKGPLLAGRPFLGGPPVKDGLFLVIWTAAAWLAARCISHHGAPCSMHGDQLGLQGRAWASRFKVAKLVGDYSAQNRHFLLTAALISDDLVAQVVITAATLWTG